MFTNICISKNFPKFSGHFDTARRCTDIYVMNLVYFAQILASFVLCAILIFLVYINIRAGRKTFLIL